MKKLLAMILALALTVSLAACGKQGETGDGQSPAETWGSPAPEESQAPGEFTPFLPDNERDVVALILGYPGDTVLLTVNGTEVTAETYCYWMSSMASYYTYLYGMYYYQNLDLNSELSPGVTWGQQIKDYARRNVILTALGPELAARYNISLTDEEMTALYQEREDKIIGAGDTATYAKQLQGMGISDRVLFQVDTATELYDKVMKDYTAKAAAGQGDGAVTAEDVAAYIQENDLLRAKHILLLTKDMNTGEEFDEEEKAAQLARIQDIAVQLGAADDPIALFDVLMQENSEDSGLAANPDGYVFTAGEMVKEFENGTRALAYGEVSPVIESSYGYHIILRLDPDCADTREKVAQAKFSAMVEELMGSATVVEAPEYAAIDTAEYYNEWIAFQNAMSAADRAEPTLEPYQEPEEEPEG